MAKKAGLDFTVDELTNSIRRASSGESFDTNVSSLLKSDIKFVTKNKGWLFNWKYEFQQTGRQTYKLTIADNSLIQGLISLEVKSDHIYMHLVEIARSMKGKLKEYAGVAGNLVAFACKLSIELGHEGNVAFVSKTQLIEHYETTLGAFHFGGRLMIIEPSAALKLANQYFRD
jgi:hypothetical protein